MKPITHTIVSSEAENYSEEHTTPETPDLRNLDRWVHLHTSHPRMAAGHYQGRLLQMLTQLKAPHRAVEIGSFVGYSTVCIARGLAEGGVLHAIEVEEEYEEVILRSVTTAGVGEKVRLHIGAAKDVVPQIEGKFDLAFIDADKLSNRLYYDMLVPRMNPGGIIIVDNVLWSGKVFSPEVNRDKDTALLMQFNDYVQADSRVDNLLLPVRDGIMVCRVK